MPLFGNENLGDLEEKAKGVGEGHYTHVKHAEDLEKAVGDGRACSTVLRVQFLNRYLNCGHHMGQLLLMLGDKDADANGRLLWIGQSELSNMFSALMVHKDSLKVAAGLDVNIVVLQLFFCLLLVEASR